MEALWSDDQVRDFWEGLAGRQLGMLAWANAICVHRTLKCLSPAEATLDDIALASPSGHVFFSWESTIPNFIILTSGICICYVHASLRVQERKFSLIYLLYNTVATWKSKNHVVTWFMGGEFTRTNMYVKHQGKIPDCLRVYSFFK